MKNMQCNSTEPEWMLYERTLTKGGGKLGLAAFFFLKAVKKEAAESGAGSDCCSEQEKPQSVFMVKR